MKKIIRLTESDLTRLIKKLVLSEQLFSSLRKIVGSTTDDIIKNFGDDAAKNIDIVFQKALSSSTNLATVGGQQVLKSASGSQIPMTTVMSVIDGVTNGSLVLDDVIKYLPRQLADGTEFREVLRQSLSKRLAQNVVKSASKSVPSWVTNRWFVTTQIDPYIGKLFEKAKKLESFKFDASKIKITNRTNIAGREVLEIKLPTGDDMLIYKSTGTGAPELKQAGDWQVIAGFVPKPDDLSDVKWFIKNEATTQLTKGLNPYLTKLDKLLKQYGTDAIGSNLYSWF